MTPNELSKVMALEAAMCRRVRRAHWYRVATVAGIFALGAVGLVALWSALGWLVTTW
jgi:hypothetical protein